MKQKTSKKKFIYSSKTPQAKTKSLSVCVNLHSRKARENGPIQSSVENVVTLDTVSKDTGPLANSIIAQKLNATLSHFND